MFCTPLGAIARKRCSSSISVRSAPDMRKRSTTSSSYSDRNSDSRCTAGHSLAPFGNNVYYSYQLYATPTNLIALAPNVSFQPLSKVRVALEYQLSWRDSVNDAVYRANGQAFAGTQDFDGRRIADTARAQIVWSISPRLSFTGRYEHLQAKSALTRAGYRSSDFLAGWLSLRL